MHHKSIGRKIHDSRPQGWYDYIVLYVNLDHCILILIPGVPNYVACTGRYTNTRSLVCHLNVQMIEGGDSTNEIEPSQHLYASALDSGSLQYTNPLICSPIC